MRLYKPLKALSSNNYDKGRPKSSPPAWGKSNPATASAFYKRRWDINQERNMSEWLLIAVARSLFTGCKETGGNFWGCRREGG